MVETVTGLMTEEGAFVASYLSEAMEPLTDMFCVSNAAAVLAAFAAGAVGLSFMWWGIRKSVSSLMSAFRKGKVSL